MDQQFAAPGGSGFANRRKLRGLTTRLQDNILPHMLKLTHYQRLEDVKQSVRLGELPRNSDNLQCFHSAFIGGLQFFHG
jgi:hypothetical protein